MQVRKRNGNIVDYDREFILRAVTLAAAAAGEHDMDVEAVVSGVEKALAKRDERVVDIETIQDAVEESLFEQDHFPTAKAYILYRVDKEKTRGRVEWKEGLLTREFLSPYKHAASPMGELGSFVYSRTYSRYIPALQPPRVLVGNGAPRRGVQLLPRPHHARGGGEALRQRLPPAPVPFRPHAVGGRDARVRGLSHGQLQLRL